MDSTAPPDGADTPTPVTSRGTRKPDEAGHEPPRGGAASEGRPGVTATGALEGAEELEQRGRAAHGARHGRSPESWAPRGAQRREQTARERAAGRATARAAAGEIGPQAEVPTGQKRHRHPGPGPPRHSTASHNTSTSAVGSTATAAWGTRQLTNSRLTTAHKPLFSQRPPRSAHPPAHTATRTIGHGRRARHSNTTGSNPDHSHAYSTCATPRASEPCAPAPRHPDGYTQRARVTTRTHPKRGRSRE